MLLQCHFNVGATSEMLAQYLDIIGCSWSFGCNAAVDSSEFLLGQYCRRWTGGPALNHQWFGIFFLLDTRLVLIQCLFFSGPLCTTLAQRWINLFLVV